MNLLSVRKVQKSHHNLELFIIISISSKPVSVTWSDELIIINGVNELNNISLTEYLIRFRLNQL